MSAAVRTATVSAAVFLCSCGPRPHLADIPAAELQGASPSVAASLTAAFSDARAYPHNAEVVGKYCMLLHAHQQFGAARHCYARLVGLAPSTFKWSYYSALVAAESGSPAQAREAFDRALQLEPNYLPGRVRRAASLLEEGSPDRSAEEYAAVVADSPENAEAHYGLGRALAVQGRLKEALIHYERACLLFPSYSAAHYAAAQLYGRLGDVARARNHLRAYERSSRTAPPPHDPYLEELQRLGQGAQAHLQRSVALAAAGKLEEAATANLEAIRLDPSSVQGHVNLISLYGRLRRFSEAESQYQAAVALNPSHSEAHYNYGVMLFDAERFAEARRAFRKTIEANPMHADAHNNYAFLVEREGKPGEALKHYREAVRLAPAHRTARFHLARLFTAAGQLQDAIGQFEQLREPEDERTADVEYGLATACYRLGDLDRALKHTRRAHDLAVKYGRRDLTGRLEHDLRVLARRRSR